jgi:pyruvate/2-oxoglutarate/acetoin dehydrogenase E1 component
VAEALDQAGVSVEIVDLRTLRPLDFDTIRRSVQKTSKLLLVHEDRRIGGIGADICSRVVEELWTDLDAPPRFVTAADCHTPFHQNLESVVLPSEQQILDEAQKLASY